MEGLNFSVYNVLAGFIFGIVGFVAFMYGRKQSLLKPMLVGAVLMAYPYFVTNTIALWSIGVVLTAFLFLFN